MPTLTIPTIKWGKRKDRSQICESFTEDGRIITVELPVLRGCVDDEKSGQGFILDAGNQYTNEDNYWTQVLWERSSFPVCMIDDSKNPDLSKLINQIYKESKKQAQLDQFIEAAKNAMSDRLSWIIAMVCGTFLIIAAMQTWG